MAPRHVQDIHGATRQQADLLGPLQRRSVFVGDAIFGRLIFEYGESSVALATHVVESLGLALALENVGLYGTRQHLCKLHAHERTGGKPGNTRANSTRSHHAEPVSLLSLSSNSPRASALNPVPSSVRELRLKDVRRELNMGWL